jgi:cbb3-type cytochrome oxidase maturation protein
MMISVYFLIFFSLAMGVVFALLFIWAVRSGQFKDVEAPKYEMLQDDDELVENDAEK